MFTDWIAFLVLGANIFVDNIFRNNSFGIGLFTNLGGKDPGQYPTADNWFVGNTLGYKSLDLIITLRRF